MRHRMADRVFRGADRPLHCDTELLYGDFFRNAPHWNERADHIRGSICGVRLDTIEDPTLKRVRQLDKLVDELSKGKAMEKILR